MAKESITNRKKNTKEIDSYRETQSPPERVNKRLFEAVEQSNTKISQLEREVVSLRKHIAREEAARDNMSLELKSQKIENSTVLAKLVSKEHQVEEIQGL